VLYDLSPGRVTVASVADVDDTVLTMIYRHTEPTEVGQAVVISVEGDLDADAAAHLEHVLRRSIDGGTPVYCDLSCGGYFGSAGARAVLSAVGHAGDRGGVLLLRGVHGMPRRVLEVVGLNSSSFLE
jgi:anti-anti-sigma factor